jgi:hypothetical protein
VVFAFQNGAKTHKRNRLPEKHISNFLLFGELALFRETLINLTLCKADSNQLALQSRFPWSLTGRNAFSLP